jgi:hypothetical protein
MLLDPCRWFPRAGAPAVPPAVATEPAGPVATPLNNATLTGTSAEAIYPDLSSSARLQRVRDEHEQRKPKYEELKYLRPSPERLGPATLPNGMSM